jgi:hypothetical protein
VAFLEDYKEQSNLASVAISSLWLCLVTAEGLVGSCPAVLPNQYQAPSAWGSIGQLAIRVNNVNKLAILVTDLENTAHGLETKLKTVVTDQVSLVQSVLNSRSRGLRTFVVDVARSLGKRVSELEIKGPGSLSNPLTVARDEVIPHSGLDAELEIRLLKLETRFDGMGPESDIGMVVDGKRSSVILACLEKHFEAMDIKVGNFWLREMTWRLSFQGWDLLSHPTQTLGWRRNFLITQKG